MISQIWANGTSAWWCVCRDEDWHDNDGALNTISMTHPRFPIEHPSHFVHNRSQSQSWEPGIWLVYYSL